MKRMAIWLIGIAFTMLILIVVVTGCGPKEAPTGELVNLELYSSPAGTPPYAMSLVTSEMLNQLHPWLRATTLEGVE